MEVVAAVLIQNSKILLARRPLGKNHGGLWEFPGGKVNSDESMKDAILRELSEELGVHFNEIEPKPLGTVQGEKINLHFFALPLTTPFFPKEHSATSWNRFEDLGKKNLCPTDRVAIEQLKDEIKKSVEEARSF